MAAFLIRSYSDPRGYTEVQYPSGKLPRSREESYVPWGVSGGDRVVYALTGTHNSWRGTGGLRRYDSNISQQRRRLAESALGSFALRNPSYTFSAVNV
jgi:hypothetical protein